MTPSFLEWQPTRGEAVEAQSRYVAGLATLGLLGRWVVGIMPADGGYALSVEEA